MSSGLRTLGTFGRRVRNYRKNKLVPFERLWLQKTPRLSLVFLPLVRAHAVLFFSVLLLKGEETLASFLDEKEAKKNKADNGSGKAESWWEGEGIAEAVV